MKKYYTTIKITMLFAMGLLVIFFYQGCRKGESAADKEAKATRSLLAEGNRQVGMPNIINFQEKKLMKQILELRDKENLITYAYIVNWEGELIFLGKCVGFGLPYSVQYTSPKALQPVRHYRPNGTLIGTDYSQQLLDQADPSGLYMPEGLSATWLMMFDEKTKEVRPVYVEPQIIVSPFPLH
jgi:hypothetical protein